jgi:nucleoside-diphosphate-sugar epimerase
MKVVITGSESFIGKELRKHCTDRGIEVTGIDALPGQNPGYHQIDIRSTDVSDVIPVEADALIHLAAISRDQDCRRDPAGAFDVNVGGTLNLVRAAQAKRVKQFIFASSEWVYGNVSGEEVQCEDSIIDAGRIASEYALTKIAGERLLFMAHQRGLCPVTVLRFGIVYGPRSTPMSPVEGFFNEVRTQDVIEVKCSLQSGRRFVHVADIAEGILSSLGHGGFEVFNLTGNKFITFQQVIEVSSKLLRRTPKVIESNAHNLNVRNPDNQKARRMLGWEPVFDLETGLESLLAFREQRSA